LDAAFLHCPIRSISNLSRRLIASDWTIVSNDSNLPERLHVHQETSDAGHIQVEICLSEFDNSDLPLLVDNTALFRSHSNSMIPLPLRIESGNCPQIFVRTQLDQIPGTDRVIEEVRIFSEFMGNKSLSVGSGYRTFRTVLLGEWESCSARYSHGDGTFGVTIAGGTMNIDLKEQAFRKRYGGFTFASTDYSENEFLWSWEYAL
jgi:hypothetical protein